MTNRNALKGIIHVGKEPPKAAAKASVFGSEFPDNLRCGVITTLKKVSSDVKPLCSRH